MADEALYGPEGHSGGFGTMEGRENGGGWVNDPLPHGSHGGRGVMAQPPAADTGTNHGAPPAPGNPSSILDTVTEWHRTYLWPRQQ